jgi:hypothetical protein
MKCKTIHKKLIFFLEGTLPKEEMEQINLHIGECKECFAFAEELKKTLHIIEIEKSPEVNPFFYTRLKARMEDQAEKVSLEKQPFFSKIVQPVILSVLLLIGIYSGIKIGQVPQSSDSNKSVTKLEIVPYLDEMADEPIETFLMN